MTRLLRHDRTVSREIDGAVLFDDVLEECRKKEFDGASQCSLNDWTSILAKGGGAKKRFQYCLNPNSSSTSRTSEQFKDIQEIMLLILSCKTRYCYQRELLSTSTTAGMQVK